MTNTLTGHDVEEGKLPEGWEVRELCELVDVLDSRRKPVNATERADRPGDVPYYGATGQVGTIDEALFDEDLVLLGEDGVQFFDPDKQKAYEISGPAWVNNHAHVLRCNQDLYQQSLLIHFLNQADYRNRANGTTRLKLTQAAMKEIPVLTPPMDEQERIVEILGDQLSRLDTALQSVRTVREKAAQFRRSLLHAAFTGALTGHDVEEGELPSGWVVSRLGDLAGLGPKVPADLLEANTDLSFVPMAAVTEVSGEVDLTQTISARDGKKRSLKYFADGDVIFAKITPCMENGKVARPSGLTNGAAFGSTEFHVLRPTLAIDGDFLRLFLVHDDFRYEAERAMTGAVGQRRVPKKYLEDFPLPTPPLEEQDRIVEILEEQLSRLDASLAVADAVEERSGALRRSLLHSAFTGRLTREWREAVNV
jgi:type I restriction enzyme S subunit